MPVGYILEVDHINFHKFIEFVNLMTQYAIVNIFISAVISRVLFKSLAFVYYAGKPKKTEDGTEEDTKDTKVWEDKWKSYTGPTVPEDTYIPEDTNITVPELGPGPK